MAAHLNSKEKRRKYGALLERDGDLCFWCEEKFSYDNPYTIDHLIPQANGGSNALFNLVLSCSFCNSKRRAMAAGEFRSWIRKHRHSFTNRRLAPAQHVESCAGRHTPAALEL